jgi:hypothetical protein
MTSKNSKKFKKSYEICFIFIKFAFLVYEENMKKTVLLILMLPLTFFSLAGQDELIDELTFSEEFAPGELNTPYFGIGGGYVAGLYFTDFEIYNDKLSNLGFSSEAFSSPVFLNGIEAFTSIPALKNFKLGVFYMAGSVTASYDGTYTRFGTEVLYHAKFSSNYKIGFAGLKLSYCFTPGKNFAINPNLALGEGSLEFDIIRSPEKIPWDDVFTTDHSKVSCETGFFFLQPGVDFEYSVTPWLLVKVGAKANIGFDNLSLIKDADRIINDNDVVTDMPDDKSLTGYQFELGFSLGLFNIK